MANNKQDRKWRPLEKMFNEVPVRYDLLNRIITLRLDEWWRKLAVQECLSGNPERALDLCTGTGDLVLRMAQNSNGNTSIHALDYSEPMLEVARKKAGEQGYNGIEFIHGDAGGRAPRNDFRAPGSLPLPCCICTKFLYTGGSKANATRNRFQTG